MIPSAVMQSSTHFLAQLADPAARALLLAAVAGLGLAAFRVRATSTRLFVWKFVLYTALAMPLLVQLLPSTPFPAPEFLQDALNDTQKTEILDPTGLDTPRLAVKRRENTAHNASRGENAATNKSQRGGRSGFTATDASVPGEVRTSLSPWPNLAYLAHEAQSPSLQWPIVAAGIYLAVAFALLTRFCVGLAFGSRLMRAAKKIDDPRVTQRLAWRASASGLAFTPQAAESELISVPVTMGARRSKILLPTSWCEWDNAQLDAVIAHEVSHVARRDALTQRLSLLHRAIFWFSPLAWWLDRRLADLAEQASDEAALSCGADRRHYARILLGFFEALHAAPGRVWWQGVSMAKAGQAEVRVERILAWKGSVAMHLKKSIAVVVVAIAIPLVYLAASAHPAHHVGLNVQLAQDQTPPPAAPPTAYTPRPQPSVPPAPAAEAAPLPEAAPEVEPALAPNAIRGTITGGISTIPVPAVAPVTGVPPRLGTIAPVAPVARYAVPYVAAAPAMPFAAQNHSSGSSSSYGSSSSGQGYAYAYGYDDDQRFVIVSGKSDSLTMSGSTADARHAEKLKKNIPGDFIWFQRDEKSYVIRDQATVDRARKLWAPQEELGKKQEALGKLQEALGQQQEALGAKMEQIHVKVPDMTAELDKLKAELKQLSSGATMEQVGHLQEEIGDLQGKIGDIQSHAGDQQGKLGEEMGALGEKQGKLGEEQGKLGEEQGKLAEEASREMKKLLDEAIAKGTAQPEI